MRLTWPSRLRRHRAGWYVGGNAGYGWGTADNNISFAQPGISPNPPATFGAQNFVKSHGAIGGAQVGYNWQIGRYLLGLEADIQAAGQKGTSTFNGSIFSLPTIAPNPATGTDIDKLNWFGTVRGRLGLTFDHWLVYGTGGLAYGSVELMGSVQPATAQIPHPNAPIVWNHSTVKVGWVVGGGIENQISRHWSWKIEYLFMDLGSARALLSGGVGPFAPTVPGNCYGDASVCVLYPNPASGTITSRFTDNIVRVGLNYQFH